MPNRSSVQVTALDGVPQTILGPVGHSEMFGQKGFLSVVTGDSIGDVYRMLRIPANAVVYDLLRSQNAITALAGDVGVYRTPDDGGAVVDADFFASAVALAAATVGPTSVMNESTVNTPTLQMLPLWQALGLSAPPASGYFDICVTVTTAATAAGTLILQAIYSL